MTVIHYLPPILGGMALLLFLILYRKGLKEYAKQLLLCLVKTAEEASGEGTGRFKYAAVATMLYDKMPAVFRLFFGERQVSVLIEAAVCAMKETLAARPSDAEEG